MDTEEVVQQVQRAPITWEAHEYVHAEKNRDWYWALGLIAIAGAVAALLFNNVLFAVLIIIASFSLALFASRKPDLVTFTLSQRGVRVDDDLYPFQSLESFGIDETPNKTPKLILKSNKIFSPGLVIPLEGIHPDEVHDFLLDFLPEGDHAESLSHHLMEYLGF
jgi:hypothetical protein